MLLGGPVFNARGGWWADGHACSLRAHSEQFESLHRAAMSRRRGGGTFGAQARVRLDVYDVARVSPVLTTHFATNGMCPE